MIFLPALGPDAGPRPAGGHARYPPASRILLLLTAISEDDRSPAALCPLMCCTKRTCQPVRPMRAMLSQSASCPPLKSVSDPAQERL